MIPSIRNRTGVLAFWSASPVAFAIVTAALTSLSKNAVPALYPELASRATAIIVISPPAA